MKRSPTRPVARSSSKNRDYRTFSPAGQCIHFSLPEEQYFEIVFFRGTCDQRRLLLHSERRLAGFRAPMGEGRREFRGDPARAVQYSVQRRELGHSGTYEPFYYGRYVRSVCRKNRGVFRL